MVSVGRREEVTQPCDKTSGGRTWSVVAHVYNRRSLLFAGQIHAPRRRDGSTVWYTSGPLPGDCNREVWPCSPCMSNVTS
eukprot:5689722-Prymnesium_polylepis.1